MAEALKSCQCCGRCSPACPSASLAPHLAPGPPGLVDRSLVLDGRDVARIAVEDDRLEDAAHDLAAARLGQHVDEVQLADDRHRPQLAPYRVEQLLAQLLRRLMPLPEHDERGDDLAAQLDRAAGDARLGDRRVAEERRLDLDGAEPVAGDLDDLVGAAANQT